MKSHVVSEIYGKVSASTVFFFDMDGTLVDTDMANFLSYKKAVKEITGSEQCLNYNPLHRFTRSSLKNAIPNLSELEYERIIREKEKCFEEFLIQVSLKKAIVSILIKYSNTNQTVLVTNCRRDRVFTTLNYFGLTDKFDHIFCRQFSTTIKRINKFENAISSLDIAPDLIIAFENEEAEIIDAIRAGIKIINPKIV